MDVSSLSLNFLISKIRTIISAPQGWYVIGSTKFEPFRWHSKNLTKLSLIIINAIIQWAKLVIPYWVFFPVVLKCHRHPSQSCAYPWFPEPFYTNVLRSYTMFIAVLTLTRTPPWLYPLTCFFFLRCIITSWHFLINAAYSFVSLS